MFLVRQKNLKQAVCFGLAFMLLIPLGLIPLPTEAAAKVDYRFDSAVNPPRVMQAGEVAKVEVKIKNTGVTNWYRSGNYRKRIIVRLAASNPRYRTSPFGFRRIRMTEAKVKPGGVATFHFQMKAPRRGGSYNERFQPVVEGRYWLKDRGMRFRVNVLGRASAVKVGITHTRSSTNPSSSIRIKGSGKFYLRDSRGRFLKSFAPSSSAQVAYRSGYYRLYCNNKLFKQSRYYPIFIPLKGTILRAPSYKGRGYNVNGDRSFRGNLIIRYSNISDSQAPKALWLINQVNVEHYLYGIAEEPDSARFESLKTIAIVARTYAIRNITHPKKICSRRGFHLFNDVRSQVYKGYEYEKRAPNLKSAVRQTRGLVITWHGKPIVAAYHSKCGGHTIGLSSYPYLKGVTCGKYHCSGGRVGHGYGMCMAGMRNKANSGWSAWQIIRHYYRGVGSKRLY